MGPQASRQVTSLLLLTRAPLALPLHRSTRFCMGTAWRELGAKKTAFKRIVGMVSDIKKLDLEVCCTLGMLSEEQVPTTYHVAVV